MFLFWTVRQRVDLNYRPFVALSVAYTLVVSAVGVVAVLLAPEDAKLMRASSRMRAPAS